MNFNNLQWINAQALIFMGLSLFLNGLVAYLWHKKFYKKLNLKTYKAIQRIHLNETPRLGGFIFALSLTSFVLYSKANENILFFKLILICLIPIIIIGLKEDLFHNVSPKARLISLIFVALLFVVKFNGPLPDLSNLPLVNKFILLPGGLSLFYVISIVTIANGMNLIDGVNGLCGVVSISILSELLFLSYKTGDLIILSSIFSLILILLPFLFFNYPHGKIFLGDLGAYILGLIISMFSILFFGRHAELSPWCAVLILIYPAIELIFTMIRRLIEGQRLFNPDRYHIHSKVFDILRQAPRVKKNANQLVMPLLLPLWLLPLILIILFYSKPLYIQLSIIGYIALYIIFYFKLRKV